MRNSRREKIQDKIFSSRIIKKRCTERMLALDTALEYPISFCVTKKTKLVKCLNSKKTDKLLEIGTHDGSYLRYATRTFECNGVGLDISNDCVETCKKIDSNPKNDYVIGSAENLPFKNNSFNGVINFSTLEHLDHPEKCILEMYRVLKPGGKIAIELPITDDKWTFMSQQRKKNPIRFKENMLKTVGHDYDKMLTSTELLQLITNTGFKTKVKRRYGIFFRYFHDSTWLSFLINKTFKLINKKKQKTEQTTEDAETTGINIKPSKKVKTMLKIYSKGVLPILKIITFPEGLLSRKIGYTILVLAEKPGAK